MELRDVGASGEAADVMLKCWACQKRKPMAPAFSQEGRAALPACRGRHPHLRVAPLEECGAASQPITLGATNMWFSRTLSALSIPSSADPLEQLVEQDLTSLLEDVESERDVKLVRKGHARYDKFTDAQIWAAMQKVRAQDSAAPLSPKDLKLSGMEAVLEAGSGEEQRKSARARREAASGVRAVDRKRGARSTVCAKCRRWRDSRGWNREATIRPRSWRRCGAVLPSGCRRLKCGARDCSCGSPKRRWRSGWRKRSPLKRSSSARIGAGGHQRGLDPSLGFPGLRYVLLHSLSHALIRQFSVECGYAAASLRERIYSSTPDDEEAMAGILIYTAAPDSEGTLGGLVTLGETANLEQHLDQALEGLEICSSDPLCAETTPEQAFMSLHGAACHNCLFLPETSCERGNRYLDRSVLVPTMERAEFAFFLP